MIAHPASPRSCARSRSEHSHSPTSTGDDQLDRSQRRRAVDDITVEGPHNFVANDMIVHNSIEQDADVVMFIYRDEYYNREDPRRRASRSSSSPSTATAPTGSVELAFREQYTLFSDLARGEA